MHYPQLDHVFFLFRSLLLMALVVFTAAGLILVPELGTPLLVLLIADLIGMASGEIAHFMRRTPLIKSLLLWIAIILTFPLNLSAALLVVAVTAMLSLVELVSFTFTPADYHLLWRNFGWRQLIIIGVGVGLLVAAFAAFGGATSGVLLFNIGMEFFGAYIIFLLIGGGLFRSGEIAIREYEKTRRAASSVLAVSLICFGVSVWLLGFNTIQNEFFLNLGIEFLGALWIYLLLESGIRGYWNVFRLAYVGHARVQYFRDRLILTAPMLILLAGGGALAISFIGMNTDLAAWLNTLAPNISSELIGAALLAWLIIGTKAKVSGWRMLIAVALALAMLGALILNQQNGGTGGLLLNYGVELLALAITFALLDARTKTTYEGQSPLKSAGERLAKRSEAQSLRERGSVLDDQGRGGAGRALYQSALLIYRKTDDLEGTADTLNNIGVSHAAEANYTEAMRYFDEAVRTYTRAFPNYSNHPRARAARANLELARQRLSSRSTPSVQSISAMERQNYLNSFRLIVVILIHAVWGLIAALPLLWWWRDTPMTAPGLPQLISAAVASVILHGVVYLVMLQLPVVSGSYHYDPVHPQALPLIGELKLSYGALSMVGVVVVGLFVNPLAAAVGGILAGYSGYKITQIVDPYGRADTPAWLYATCQSFVIATAILLLGGFELGSALLLSAVVIFAANFIGTMVVAVLTSLAKNTKAIVFMPLGIGIAALMMVWLLLINRIIG